MDHECAICLEKMKLGSSLEKDSTTPFHKDKGKTNTVTTPCNHTYHKACFEKWLRVSNTCPNCRTVLYETIPVPIVLPPFDGELQLQWIARDLSGMSNMTREFTSDFDHFNQERIQRDLEQEQMQSKVMTVASYVFCIIGTAYCLGDCSGTVGSILGGY